MMTNTKIKRALISVYDKTGIIDFARSLSDEFGVAIISTGGTALLLEENQIPVTLVEEVTGFPEMMDGRVKTLHPKIHAAILADRDNPDHMRQLAAQGIEPIDMVVVNLYPFEKTIADPDCTFEQAIEMIDIGGPCMLRAAAKNHKHVWVVTDPEYYTSRLAEMRDWHDSSLRRIALDRGGIDAFALTCALDAGIVKWLTEHADTGRIGYSALFTKMIDHLRYGENPHQSASVTTFPRETMLQEWNAASHQADVELSFNNYVDGHAALALCKELAANDRLESRSHIRESRSHIRNASVGPTFQSVNAGSTTTGPITDETHTKRHLPHIQTPGSHYFVTFRIRQGSLNPKERTIVLDACRFLHGTKMTLHACVVMPDHVHLVITPHQISPGCCVSLGEIAKSIKGFSARTINKQRHAKGSLWMDEVWDRIIRDENEYLKRLDYITGNPSKADLGEDYEWVWVNDRAWDDLAANDRLESRSHIRESRSHIRESRSHIRQKICVFIKHTNACGAGMADDPVEAYRRAYLGDPNAAMGGVLACSFSVDAAFAEAVMDTYARWGKAAGAGGFFAEVWIAPEFDEDAIELIRTKKKWGQRVRLLSAGDMTVPANSHELEYKCIAGGLLVQTRDVVGLNEEDWKIVTKRKPTETELADLRLAWLVCKHTKSNAITVCKDQRLIGNGAGQMSRVMSCRIATWLAKENGHQERLGGAVAASDAFFPFRDGPEILIDAGITAVIQPGGSKRDEDTIQACDQRSVAMIFTGTRHFKH